MIVKENLNAMCADCARLGKGCAGCAEAEFNQCAYKKFGGRSLNTWITVWKLRNH